MSGPRDLSIYLSISLMLSASAFAVLSSCTELTDLIDGSTGEYQLDLPDHFPQPSIPEDNPLSTAKVELGRHLFYETRLSVSGQTSCATCHLQAFAFTDGASRSLGATGQETTRNSMSLTNVAYNSRLTWSNSLIDTLESQALLPMFGENPVEMGLSGIEDDVLAELQGDDTYRVLFAAAWPTDAEPVSWAHVTQAIASFQRTLISADSAYDRFIAGDETAMNESAQRGMSLFYSERLECFHCHNGFNFTDSTTHDAAAVVEVAYHNTGLYNLDGRGSYPVEDVGLMEVTGDERDMGRYRAPTLRNIAVTAPYMHDGSMQTLDEVIDHYSRGGRLIASGPYAGDGAESPLKSEFVPGFVLTSQERADLIAFLDALTDEAFLSNPAFSDPRP